MQGIMDCCNARLIKRYHFEIEWNNNFFDDFTTEKVLFN